MARELLKLNENVRINQPDQLWGVLDEALAEKKRGNTQVVAALSPYGRPGELKQSLSKSGFHIQKEWGRLFLVAREKEVPFYTYLQDSIVYFITLARKTEDIPGTILNYIRSSKDVLLIRLGSERMRSIRSELARDYPGMTLSYFTAHRATHSPIRCAYREDSHRTIIYSGNDGFDTLEEMEYHYGVIPRIMEFHMGLTDHSRLGFRFDVNGIFTIMEGSSAVVRYILDTVVRELKRYALPLSVRGKRIGAESILRGTVFTKWKIPDIEKIEVALATEWDITAFQNVYIPRKRFLYSRLVDVEDRAVWELTLRGNELNLLPVRGTGMRSLMKIVEVLEDHVGFTHSEDEEVEA